MDIFDFEELMADMLDVTDEQREDDDHLPNMFYEKYDIDFNSAFELACDLLKHTVPIEAGLSGKQYYAFVNKEKTFMLMKSEVTSNKEK